MLTDLFKYLKATQPSSPKLNIKIPLTTQDQGQN